MRSHDHLHHASSGNGMVDHERRLIGADEDMTSTQEDAELAADAALSALLNQRDGAGADDLFAYLHENLIENLLAAAQGSRVDLVVKYGSCSSAKELLNTMAIEWARARAQEEGAL